MIISPMIRSNVVKLGYLDKVSLEDRNTVKTDKGRLLSFRLVKLRGKCIGIS